MDNSKFRLQKTKSPNILEKTNADFLSKEDKAVFDIVFQALKKTKQVRESNDPSRLQQLAYLLVQRIKENFEDFYSDKTTIKAFKSALTDKLTEDLAKSSIGGKDLFTRTDVEKLLDSILQELTQPEFLKKYFGVLSEQNVKKKIANFVEEFQNSKKARDDFAKLVATHTATIQKLTDTTKNLVKNADMAKALQDKVFKQIDNLQKTVSGETKKAGTAQKEDATGSSGNLGQSDIPKELTDKQPKTTDGGHSFLSKLFLFGGLGAGAGVATFSLFSKAKPDSFLNNPKKKMSDMFKKTKTKLSFGFFNFRKSFGERVSKMKDSLTGLSKKLGKGLWTAVKIATMLTGAVMLAPFYFLGKAVSSIFKKHEDEEKKLTLAQKLKLLLKSPGFMFGLGLVLGFLYKYVWGGILKIWDGVKKSIHWVFDHYDWIKEKFANLFETVKNGLVRFWGWVTNPETWQRIGDKISSMFPTLGTLIQNVTDTWHAITDFFKMDAIKSMLSIVTRIADFLQELRQSAFGKFIFRVITNVWAGTKDLVSTMISAGIGWGIWAVTNGISKMFKQDIYDDKNTMRRAIGYRFSDEYAKGVGGTTQLLGNRIIAGLNDPNVRKQFADNGIAIDNAQQTIESMVARNAEASQTFDTLLGPDKGSIAWNAARLMRRADEIWAEGKIPPTFLTMKKEYLDKIFAIEFLTDTDIFNPISKMLKSTFLMLKPQGLINEDNIKKAISTQQAFLTAVMMAKQQLYFLNARIMEKLGPYQYYKMLKDGEYATSLTKLETWDTLNNFRTLKDLQEMMDRQTNGPDGYPSFIENIIKKDIQKIEENILDKYFKSQLDASKSSKRFLDMNLLLQDFRGSFPYVYFLAPGPKTISYQMLKPHTGNRATGIRNWFALEGPNPEYTSEYDFRFTGAGHSLFMPQNINYDSHVTLRHDNSALLNIPVSFDKAVAYENIVASLKQPSEELQEITLNGKLYDLPWQELKSLISEDLTEYSYSQQLDETADKTLAKILWEILDELNNS